MYVSIHVKININSNKTECLFSNAHERMKVKFSKFPLTKKFLDSCIRKHLEAYSLEWKDFKIPRNP